MKQISVDVVALAEAYSQRGLDAESWLDTETGELRLVPHEAMTHAEHDEPDPTMSDWMRAQVDAAREVRTSGRFVLVPADENRSEFRDMERFISTVQDGQIARRLRGAIVGRGGFRRFKDEADDLGVLDDWYAFAEACVADRAVDWLASQGLAPLDS